MTIRLQNGVSAAIISMLVGSTAWAQDAGQPVASEPAAQTVAPAPTPVAAAADQANMPPDSAFLLQARLQTQTGLMSLSATSPGFLVGYQGKGFGIGLGLGFARLSVSSDSGGSDASLSLIQIAPTALIDVWQSQDQRTRANLVASVGYGRASVTSTSQSCIYDSVTGTQTCTNHESTTGATLIPVQLGFGGDHFLSRNFGVGAEAGAQLMFVTGIEEEGQSANMSASTQAVYGLLRMTLLVGG